MRQHLKVYGYARLSREDLRGAEATEEKLQARAQMCMALAEQHGLPLRREDVITERGSGTSIADRDGLCRLLSMARAGAITHIVTPYQDRLTRGGDSDRGAIKEALCAGNVTVVTSEGVMAFDRDFGDREELIFDIKAVVASHFVRDIVKKRKEADLVRLKQGKSHLTAAPYGYYRVSKKDILEGRYAPDQLGTMHVIEDEYPILEEIFRRIAIEKAPDICRDFNVRGILPPSSKRPGIKGTRWHPSGMYKIIRNPFYIGLLSQKKRAVRGRGMVHLKPDEYVLADVKGDWRCPISEEQHYSFQSRIEGHKGRAAARSGLLTGVVFCPAGRPMRIAARNIYGCDCKERGEPHIGRFASCARLDAWAQLTINALVESLPDSAAPAPDKRAGKTQALTTLARARRDLAQKEQQSQDMILRESYFVSLLGRQTFEATAKKTRAALEALRVKVREIEAIASEPDGSKSLSIFRGIRRLGGMPRIWEEATDAEKRRMVELVIRRIELIAPEKRYYTAAKIVLWDWAAAFPFDAPPFPKMMGRVENLIFGDHGQMT